jgi:PAS domain S-box-containing protein
MENKADIILGGLITCRMAQERGLKVLLVASGDASFRAACLEAQKVAYARKIEKERTEQFRVLVDYSIDGIISVDRDKKIQVFNPAAERILSISAGNVVGSTIDSLFPSFQVDECLRLGTEYVDEIIPFQRIKIMANVAPIRVGRDISGVMITFQDTSHIAELEVKIRKELYTKGLTAKYHFQHILGVSPEMTEARRIALQFSEIDATVLISGASGTGKELFAQSRKKGPFVAVNCAALPPNLLESELFGYVEGAFTGANRKGKPGLFELAHSGTIFLDEISEMDRYGQSRLLRVLQEKQVMRLGDDKVIPIDVRVIAATNKNLRALVARFDFREDLFYRLNVLHFSLPLLRDRTGDVRFLADHFIKQCQVIYKKRVEYDESVISVLEKYEWPGNVRELHNVLERLVIIARDNRITKSDTIAVLEHDIAGLTSPQPPQTPPAPLSVDEEPAERERIIDALKRSAYNQTDAAKRLGMDRSTLYRKIRRYGIDWKLL